MTFEISLDRETFKALAGDTRIQILKALNKRRKTQSELAAQLGLRAPTVNEHLEVLKKAGLVHLIDEGRKWKYYALTHKGKGVLNPADARIMLLLGISSLGLVTTLFYLFSRFIVGSGESALQMARQVSVQPISAGSKVLGSQTGERVADITATAANRVAADTLSNLPRFAPWELGLLLVLALLVGALLGIVWQPKHPYN